jgi:uncharacterized OB-fold protein
MDRPLPVIDADTAPFWAAARERKLLLQRCRSCGEHVFYPRSICPHCHQLELDWVEVSGRGRIYSYTVARRPAGPAFVDEVPYVLVLVDLDEGPRMLSNLRVSDVDSVRIGQRVQADFEPVSEEITLPVFTVTD